ncbi:multidrug resistance protein [Escherichia coli]|uniref:Multidrug resistance protein n=1 Tax=Escherichia coli TaxID=562 RepID=A0A485JNV6_ECOLX|nr:multidrug resistance protein [Escherichia coli]
MPRFFARHAATLFFPMALILYDFAAYLSTDLIQPGIINVVRDFNADVSLAPAAVSLYLAGGMALQWLLGPLSDRIGRRPVLITGALIFTLACAATMFTTSMTQFLSRVQFRAPVSVLLPPLVMSRCRRRSDRQKGSS